MECKCEGGVIKKACIVDTWDDGNAYRAELLESGKCVFVPMDDDRCAWWYPDQLGALRAHIKSLYPQIDSLREQEENALQSSRSIAARTKEKKKYAEKRITLLDYLKFLQERLARTNLTLEHSSVSDEESE